MVASGAARKRAIRRVESIRMRRDVRILIADDYGPWRRELCRLLGGQPELRVVCEALDGAEAVHKSAELKPDLILLDISIPKMNGIEAAREIRKLSPRSKIVFVSLDNSPLVVKVALSTGAQGYVYKARAQSELLTAIAAVLRGERFITGMLKGCRFRDTSGSRAPYLHEVQFYSDEAILLDRFAGFAARALQAKDVAIVIATDRHLDALVPKLSAQNLDMDAAIQEGRYVPFQVEKMLSSFMVNGMPDSSRFEEVASGLIEAAAKEGTTEHPRVATCEECAPLLWTQGKAEAAIRLEQLWGQIAITHEVDILCAYDLNSFLRDEDRHVFRNICAEHSVVYSR